MKGTDLLYLGQAVTLEEMLQARDKRAARQRQALNCLSATVDFPHAGCTGRR